MKPEHGRGTHRSCGHLPLRTRAFRRKTRTYVPPHSVVGRMLHSHLTHLLDLLPATSSGEQRQVVAPHLWVIAVTLQSARQRVQGGFQTLCCRPTDQHTTSELMWGKESRTAGRSQKRLVVWGLTFRSDWGIWRLIWSTAECLGGSPRRWSPGLICRLSHWQNNVYPLMWHKRPEQTGWS